MQAYMLETNGETVDTIVETVETGGKKESLVIETGSIESIIETESVIETESILETESVTETEVVLESESIIETEADAFPEPVIESETESESETEKEELSESDRLLGEFIDRCYRLILSRDNDEEGKATWMNALKNEGYTGAEVSLGFVESNEFKAKNLSDEDYVDVLYEAFLGRHPDASGRALWVDMLQNGMSRRYVARGFIESTEFTELCKSFGIRRGYVILLENRDANYHVTTFIYRCYEVFLGRTADLQGLNDWCRRINSKEITAEKLAYGFVFSKEFKANNYSDEEYVARLYEGMFGRAGDAEGTQVWLRKLEEGASREDVFLGFANSKEFEVWVNKSIGNFTPETIGKTIGEQKVEQYVDQILAEVNNKLYGSYKWCVNNITYKKLPIPMTPLAGYTEDEYYAVYAYENRQGNCYCYAAAFYQLALELGYDAEFIQGKVGMAAGGTGPHAWVEIHVNGGTYVCDPDAEYETGRNAYMVTYSSAPFKYYK